MTLTSFRGDDLGVRPDESELLIREARLETRRRRLRVLLALFIVVVAAIAIWQGSGGVRHPLRAPRIGTSSPGGGAPPASSNGVAPMVLNGQSINRVVAFGTNTLWVFTANEEALTGGGQGIELTTNAGKTWTDVTPPTLSVDGADRWMGNFTALSATSAWLTYGRIDSGPQIIEATTNAGKTWTSVGVLPPHGCALQFVSIYVGTCTVLGGALGSMTITIFRTANGGATWRQVFANTPNTTWATRGSIPFACDKNIDFTGAEKGFALFFCAGGSGAIVEETLNGGATWVERDVAQPSSVPEGGGGFTGPPVFRGSRGAIPYSVGRDSEVYVTDDGGVSFHPVYPPGRPRPWSEDIASPTMWRLSYGKTILSTDNAGRTWSTVTSSTVLEAMDYVKGEPPGGTVQFATDNDGWLLENQYDTNSVLLRTTDGGRQWRKSRVPGTKKL